MEKKDFVSRRDFLKIIKANLLLFAFPSRWFSIFHEPLEWPSISFQDLPTKIKDIISIIPSTKINREGYLNIYDSQKTLLGKVPLAQTQWNKERDNPGDRLNIQAPWGIVLHWYGDKANYDRSIEGYLRGFDELREIENYITRTSAHFLVGPGSPIAGSIEKDKPIGIVQTQIPDDDGIPFLASHLSALNYQIHKEKKQYFVRALYELGYNNPNVHSLLQDFFDGPWVDPNLQTIAIEATGHDFDKTEFFPSNQQIANVVAVVWAVMKRYKISALNILGHHEIHIGKPDPGKRFISLIRYLLGLKALVENDGLMKQLIFGPFRNENNPLQQAVSEYFKYIRNYLVLVSLPNQVYEWEKQVLFWNIYDTLIDTKSNPGSSEYLHMPVGGQFKSKGAKYLDPAFHEGIDMYLDNPDSSSGNHIRLIADGECIYMGKETTYHHGNLVIFRHHSLDGTEFLSIYGHLNKIEDLIVGQKYPQDHKLGTIETKINQCYLHFALAYGATWTTDLKKTPNIPLCVGRTWIHYRYMNPLDYLTTRLEDKDTVGVYE